MPKLRPKLAKLTRPRLHKAVARERLFRLLDDRRSASVVWISGPPGAGKTTLVASYLEENGSPAVWCHCDAGDSDPATLFYYLVEGIAQAASTRAKRLPLLTTEYLSDLEGFARRFVRAAFARLPAGALLVFDNYHEIAGDSAVHRMLNAAFAEVPETANVIVISRSPPPAAFARLQLGDTLAPLGWDDLRLTPAETAAIAVPRLRNPTAQALDALHARTDGWAAGVRLLLDRMEATGAVAVREPDQSLEAVFDYFASEIFDAQPDEVRQLLLTTAYLPRFTAEVAAAASGNPRAARLLEDLYRRRLFVEQRPGAQATYQLHDLFRAFLRARAAEQLSTGQLAAIVRNCAGLLLAGGLADEAFGLFVQVQDWPRAEQLLVEQAQALIGQGRWRTLEEWGMALPAERVEHNPWLRYWLGRSQTLVDPGAGRLVLEGACASFGQSGDALGELLSAAAVVDALHFEVTTFQLMGPWLERLARLAEKYSNKLTPDQELSVHATLLTASTHRALPGPTLDAAADKIKLLLPECSNPNLTLSVANMVHYYSSHCLDAQAHRIAAMAARKVLKHPEILADRLVHYGMSEGYAHYMFGRYREALACFDEADALIEEHGLTARLLVAGAWRIQCEATMGDLPAAQATLSRIEKRITLSQNYMSVLFDWARSMVASAGADLGLSAMARNREYGYSPVSHALWLPRQTYRFLACGRVPEASAFLAEYAVEAKVMAYCHIESAVALMRAWMAHLAGDAAQCESWLKDALACARDERQRLRLVWYPLALAQLLPVALERSIEPDIARALIVQSRLEPPQRYLEAWPWPVRIHTLGRFEVQVGDRPIGLGRKPPRRTLALLKALIAFGGSEVPEQWLIDALWPELEGDAAHDALAAALHRLRRLLGANQFIVQSDGMLSLDPARCFVDTWAFEDALRERGQESTALRLYRGGFLQGEAQAPWSVSPRERLRGKFVRAVQTAAQRFEHAARHEDAIALYLRGIEADELMEPFYQGLMRSYARTDRVAEARAAFMRLARTLGATLGVRPSTESRRLFEALAGSAGN